MLARFFIDRPVLALVISIVIVLLVGAAGEEEVSPALHRRALAELLLERHGILTRELVLAEGVPGGFSAIYSELCQLETLGGTAGSDDHGACREVVHAVCGRCSSSEVVDLLTVVLDHRDDPLSGKRCGFCDLDDAFEEEPQPVLPGPVSADAL